MERLAWRTDREAPLWLHPFFILLTSVNALFYSGRFSRERRHRPSFIFEIVATRGRLMIALTSNGLPPGPEGLQSRHHNRPRAIHYYSGCGHQSIALAWPHNGITCSTKNLFYTKSGSQSAESIWRGHPLYCRRWTMYDDILYMVWYVVFLNTFPHCLKHFTSTSRHCLDVAIQKVYFYFKVKKNSKAYVAK